MKGSGTPQVGLNGERRVSEAVTAIAKGASEGDPRLQQAFGLLNCVQLENVVPSLASEVPSCRRILGPDRVELLVSKWTRFNPPLAAPEQVPLNRCIQDSPQPREREAFAVRTAVF